MKNKILKNILILYLWIQPFLDVLATTRYHSINLLVRSLFFIGIFIDLWIHTKNKKILIFISISGLICTLYSIYHANIYDTFSSIVKLYYLPLTILFFYHIEPNILHNRQMSITLLIYIILYLTSYIFHFGQDIYLEIEKKNGFKGVFNSINEIGAIIIGLLPITLQYLKENKKNLISSLLILAVFTVSLLAATKVLMIGLILIILFIYLKDGIVLYKKQTLKTKVITIITICILLLIGCILLVHTNTFKNMLVQANFFKVNNIFSINFINKVLFNNRLTFLIENFNFFLKQDFLTIIFGIGYNHPLKLVEIDIFDILFRYGILGLISFTIPTIIIFKKVHIKKIAKFSIILLILISLTSGHVLLNPNVLIYFGYIIACNQINKKINDVSN